MLNIDQIKEIIPHRYPFLLIDRVTELEKGKRITGVKNVTANEPFFQGHFPDLPIMPGVLIIEALAQLGGVLLLSEEKHKGKVALFGGMDKVRFRRPVLPGDQIEMEVTHLQSRGDVGKVRANARVGNQVVATGELTYVLRHSYKARGKVD